MQQHNQALIERIMSLPILQAEWVLWLLFALSALSVAIIVERSWFLLRRRIDVDDVRARLSQVLLSGEREVVIAWLNTQDSLETNVLSEGLSAAQLGPDAVEELVRSAVSRERQRYERSLTLLAIVGSNAPFIGLFGTVLGIIHAFQELATKTNGAGSSATVMSGVSEALVATAVGLLVAIPAVSAFNFFKAKVRARIEGADQLVRTLLAELKSDGRELTIHKAA